MTRVTLTLDETLLQEARTISCGNLSRFVGGLIEERLESTRRQRLREELRAGYIAEAEADLQIVEEYRCIDRDANRLEEG